MSDTTPTPPNCLTACVHCGHEANVHIDEFNRDTGLKVSTRCMAGPGYTRDMPPVKNVAESICSCTAYELQVQLSKPID